MPSGSPKTSPKATETEDCHATEAASWRWVKPIAFRRASSRLRRRTLATSVRPGAPTAPTARIPASHDGVEPMAR